MARPSNQEERRDQIMQGFMRAVARFGLDGATLERIASESGLKRPLVRHHLGNRDDMISALVDHVVAQVDQDLAQARAALPRTDRIDALLNLLFGVDNLSDPAMVATYSALTTRAAEDPAIATRMRGALERLEAFLVNELTTAYPHAPTDDIKAVALGLIALSFNLEGLFPLGLHDRLADPSRRAAELLLSTLPR